jgi:hypothetical protein
VKASSWSLENFWKSSSVAVICGAPSLSPFRIRKEANWQWAQYVHCTMEVKARLLHCSKIGIQLPKQTSDKIKNSKLFQSITPVFSAVTSLGSTVAGAAPITIPKAC